MERSPLRIKNKDKKRLDLIRKNQKSRRIKLKDITITIKEQNRDGQDILQVILQENRQVFIYFTKK